MPRGSDGRGELRVDSSDLARLASDLKQMQPALRRELARTIRKQGVVLLGRVKANAAWSSRIPAATSMRVNLTGKRAGVTISTNKNKAPHARPLERGSSRNRGVNRHPVFGDRENWVNQPLRPYMLKAADGPWRAQAHADVADVIDRIARRSGFR